MSNSITLKGQSFELLAVRRNTTRVYRALDGKSYLRVGPPEAIRQEAGFHKQLLEQSYPVPAFIEEGIMESGEAYFLEASVGEEKFGLIFKREFEEQGAITDPTYSQFIEVVGKYLAAEQRTTHDPDWESVFQAVRIEILLKEMPEKKQVIMSVWEKIMADLKDFPFALCHGDFNAFNILPGGVIDFETPFQGPLGYDLVCAATTIDWFPKRGDCETIAAFAFTSGQSDRLLALAPVTAEHFAALFMLRACWHVVRMDQWPKLQAWRYQLFWEVAEVYLAGGSVYEWWQQMPEQA